MKNGETKRIGTYILTKYDKGFSILNDEFHDQEIFIYTEQAIIIANEMLSTKQLKTPIIQQDIQIKRF